MGKMMNKSPPVRSQTVLSRLLDRLTSPSQLAHRAGRQVDLALDVIGDRFIWVTDHGERVGLIDKDEAILEWIAPHPGIDAPGPRAVPAVYHAHRMTRPRRITISKIVLKK